MIYVLTVARMKLCKKKKAIRQLRKCSVSSMLIVNSAHWHMFQQCDIFFSISL